MYSYQQKINNMNNTISSITNLIDTKNKIKDDKLASLENMMDDLMPDLYAEESDAAYSITINEKSTSKDILSCLDKINEIENIENKKTKKGHLSLASHNGKKT